MLEIRRGEILCYHDIYFYILPNYDFGFAQIALDGIAMKIEWVNAYVPSGKLRMNKKS